MSKAKQSIEFENLDIGDTVIRLFSNRAGKTKYRTGKIESHYMPNSVSVRYSSDEMPCIESKSSLRLPNDCDMQAPQCYESND